MNNNPLSPSISTTTHSHLQYQQQPTLTSNINNNPLSPPISTTTHFHLQYQQQQPLLTRELVVVDIEGDSGSLLIFDVRRGCCC
jgi:hypothetical protein